MLKSVLLAGLLLTSVASFAQTWSVDKAHTRVGFTTTHLMISEVDGYFKTFDAKITAAKPDLSDAVVEMTADVNSVDTNNDRRDGDLRSERFFDVAKYPTLTFKSTSFKKVEGKKYKMMGDLTIHGVTKPVMFDVTMNGPVTMDNPRGKQEKAGFKVAGTIKRSDFNVGAALPLAVVSDEIELKANAEFSKDAPAGAAATK